MIITNLKDWDHCYSHIHVFNPSYTTCTCTCRQTKLHVHYNNQLTHNIIQLLIIFWYLNIAISLFDTSTKSFCLTIIIIIINNNNDNNNCYYYYYYYDDII